ncbi:hypothetical protein [Frankia sp. CiP3]|uniref:hypothetical protein n=1 Tax=Frankia sp. CiP3 TaxID=2880971 RepID=UPI001EF3DE05|nr:hypothetical protein [Frankia sp. CiP3]
MRKAILNVSVRDGGVDLVGGVLVRGRGATQDPEATTAARRAAEDTAARAQAGLRQVLDRAVLAEVDRDRLGRGPTSPVLSPPAIAAEPPTQTAAGAEPGGPPARPAARGSGVRDITPVAAD